MLKTGNKIKSNKAGGKYDSASRNTLKATAKQKTILAEARAVFARYPYYKASLRLICEKTGINHNLIRYHFGSKEKLFEALVDGLIFELETGFAEFKADTSHTMPKESFTRFINVFLRTGFLYSDSMKIIMQNTGSRNVEPDYPGSGLLKALTDIIQAKLLNNYEIKATEKELTMWVTGFAMAFVCIIGAEDSLMIVSGFDQEPTGVRHRVADFLITVFFPSFDYLLSGPSSKAYDDFEILPTKPGVFDMLRNGLPEYCDPPPATKGEITRKRILSAARTVFSKNSYDVGTIRMIGKEGGLDFTLIRHYFSSKEILFNDVVRDLFKEFNREVLLVYKGLDKIKSTVEGHRLSSKRLVNHCFSSADALSIIMQNAARLGEMEISVPGLEYIMKFITATEEIVQNLETLNAPIDEIRYLLLFKALILINGIGAASVYARLHDMSPDGKKYQVWIYDIYNFLIYPLYSKLIVTYGTEI